MKIDPQDLIDAHEVAHLLGLASNRVVSTYRARYEDFPEPTLTKGAGKCVLWLRSDIEAWKSRHAR